MNKVEIKVGGKSYAGWKSVRIEAGIEQISRAFALEVTESFPGNTDFSVFRGGELVQVFIDEDLVCTGYEMCIRDSSLSPASPRSRQ